MVIMFLVLLMSMLLVLSRSYSVQSFLLSATTTSIALATPILSLPSQSLSSSLSSSSSVLYGKDIVRQQLGYLPSNYVKVSAWKKTKKNVPVAIQTYPLNGGSKHRQKKSKLKPESDSNAEATSLTRSGKSTSANINTNMNTRIQSPFPTLFWLVDPDISKAVADLERRGYVQRFEDRFNSVDADPELSHRLLRCHEDYAELRWKSLTDDDRMLLTTTTTTTTTTSLSSSSCTTAAAASSSSSSSSPLDRMRNMIDLSGISGTNITDWNNKNDNNTNNRIPPIKCLHAHYAHYRSTTNPDDTNDDESSQHYSNPVGEMIHYQLQKDFPALEL